MKKLLKKVGIWAGLFVLALILISFLLPAEFEVKRSVTINAPMFRVYDQVVDLRNWERWSPWKRRDPSMVMTFSNPPVGEGAFYKWESENKQIGSGTLTLSRVVPDNEVVTSIDFEKHGKASSVFTFAHEKDAIKLTWSMKNKVGMMPWNKYFGLMMKGELKKQFDEGLEAIKFYAEKS